MITSIYLPWLRSIAVGEQLLPLELASGSDEDQLHPGKSSMDTIGMALDQVYTIQQLLYMYSGKFCRVQFSWMLDLDHFTGLIFMDACTHTHYALHNRAYFMDL